MRRQPMAAEENLHHHQRDTDGKTRNITARRSQPQAVGKKDKRSRYRLADIIAEAHLAIAIQRCRCLPEAGHPVEQCKARYPYTAEADIVPHRQNRFHRRGRHKRRLRRVEYECSRQRNQKNAHPEDIVPRLLVRKIVVASQQKPRQKKPRSLHQTPGVHPPGKTRRLSGRHIGPRHGPEAAPVDGRFKSRVHPLAEHMGRPPSWVQPTIGCIPPFQRLQQKKKRGCDENARSGMPERNHHQARQSKREENISAWEKDGVDASKQNEQQHSPRESP